MAVAVLAGSCSKAKMCVLFLESKAQILGGTTTTETYTCTILNYLLLVDPAAVHIASQSPTKSLLGITEMTYILSATCSYEGLSYRCESRRMAKAANEIFFRLVEAAATRVPFSLAPSRKRPLQQTCQPMKSEATRLRGRHRHAYNVDVELELLRNMYEQ